MRDRVIAGPIRVGPAGSKAADRRIDQRGIDALQPLQTRTEARGRARSEVLNVDVSLSDQLLKDFTVARVFQIAHYAPLVAVVGLEMRRIEPPLVTSVRIALRALNLDDIGAEVRKHHSRTWTGDKGSLLHHANSAEYL